LQRSFQFKRTFKWYKSLENPPAKLNMSGTQDENPPPPPPPATQQTPT
ncbi:hypothetical protein Tco_0643130, partial [Tanacetum coccineum]